MTQPQPLTLEHLVRPPLRPGEGAPPLLILLHGNGSNERDLFSFAPQLDERFLIISVRSPIALPNGGFSWYRVTFTNTGPMTDPTAAAKSQQLLDPFITEAVEAYHADASRVYLMGFSQGAIMSISTMLIHPEKISGVVAMSGRLLTEIQNQWVEPERLRDFPVLVVHGLYDDVLPIGMGQAIRDHLQTLPVALTYKEYPFAHQISGESLHDIKAWLSARLDA